MWLAVLLLCCLHVGVPVVAPGSFTIGEIRASGPELGLREALRSSLARALSARGALSGPAGVPVEIALIDASTVPLAASGDAVQVHSARLTVAWQLLGARPRRLVLQGERSYEVWGSDSLGASAARSAAFATLAAELSEDAVLWILYGEKAGAQP